MLRWTAQTSTSVFSVDGYISTLMAFPYPFSARACDVCQGAAGAFARKQAPVLVASAASVGYVGLAAVATGGLPVAAFGAIGAYNAATVGLSVAFDRGVKQGREDGAGYGEKGGVPHGGSKLPPAGDKAGAIGEGVKKAPLFPIASGGIAASIVRRSLDLLVKTGLFCNQHTAHAMLLLT